MRTLATRIPTLRRIPDGETGKERAIWLEFQLQNFKQAVGLERAGPRDSNQIVEMKYDQMQLSQGINPMEIRWPDLGYASYYLDAWRVFQKQYPTPLAAVAAYIRRD